MTVLDSLERELHPAGGSSVAAMQDAPRIMLNPADAGVTTELSDTSTGKWVVTTVSSRYLLDLDGRTAVREPGKGTRDDDRYQVNRWEFDEDPMEIVRVNACIVGEPLYLLVNPLGWLISTPVRSIEPAPEGGE